MSDNEKDTDNDKNLEFKTEKKNQKTKFSGSLKSQLTRWKTRVFWRGILGDSGDSSSSRRPEDTIIRYQKFRFKGKRG